MTFIPDWQDSGVIANTLADTDGLGEGSTNLYYTDTRADARITLQKGAVNGLATLDAGGKIPGAQMPAIAITDTFVVASQAAMLALSTAQTGDVAVRTDENKSYILQGTDPSVLGDWQELLSPSAPVTSVNGFTGAVSLTTTDINEGTNLYFTDERVDDRVASLLQNGTGISFSYNDGANTLTPTVTLSPFSTTDLSEGTNLYFTDARAIAATNGRKITTVTTTTFTATDEDIVLGDVVTAGADITLTLPTAASRLSAGRSHPIKIKHMQASGFKVQIAVAGVETIDGLASIELKAKEAVELVSDGTNWFIV